MGRSHGHRAPESICIIISEKESVTNLTGTLSFRGSRRDVNVGGEIVRTIKSYKRGVHIKHPKSHRKGVPSLGHLRH